MDDILTCRNVQAAREFLTIEAAGLRQQFLDQLEYEKTRRKPWQRTKGCLSYLHGDRWRHEEKQLNKREQHDHRCVSCNLAGELGIDPQEAMQVVTAAQRDVSGMVRGWFYTVACLRLAGVQIELPGDSVPVNLPEQKHRENLPDASPAPNRKPVSQICDKAKPAPIAPSMPMPTVQIMGARR